MDLVKNRYMFDTNALNNVCKSKNEEMEIYRSKAAGYEYYFSEIQCIESGANIKPSRPSDAENLIDRSRAEWAVNLLRVIPKIQTKYIGLIATLRPNRWALDGTFECLPNKEAGACALFQDVLNENDSQHYNDAMIAMTAIVHGCIVVTDDKRLFNKINAHYPGRAVRYAEFVSALHADSTTWK